MPSAVGTYLGFVHDRTGKSCELHQGFGGAAKYHYGVVSRRRYFNSDEKSSAGKVVTCSAVLGYA